MTVEGFVSSPAAGRGNRSSQHFYCNGRYIKSALLQAAVEQAYKNTLLTGRFPSCVLYISLSCGAVDVNVHPAKTEVKFSDEKKLFDLVYQAVRATLEQESGPLEIKLSESTRRLAAEPRPDFFKTVSAADYRKTAPKAERRETERPVFKPAPTHSAHSPSREVFPARSMPQAVENTPPKTPSYTGKSVENSVENVESITKSACRVIGEALGTYILAEQDGELMLIDKHAAHERMIFDRLKAQGREIMSQTLLSPVIIKPTAADAELIEKNEQLLSSLGFEIEPFGASELAIRALPDDIDPGEAESAVEELCEKLRRGGVSAQDARDELLHTVACKAAIKAGRRHDISELERIAAAVAAGEVRYCPHGRPVSARLTKKELDKFFSRIV